MKLNSAVLHKIHSSAQPLKCSAIIASTNASSMTKSRSLDGVETVGGDLRLRRRTLARPCCAMGSSAMKPKRRATSARSIGKRRARQRRRAQRQHVHAAAAIRQPLAVALQFFAVCQPVVRRQHRLGALHVRVAGQNHVSASSRQRSTNARCSCTSCSSSSIDRIAAPKPQVGRYLIVPAAGGVQLSPGIANSIDQCPFDMEMNVFKLELELEFSLLNLLANRFQPLLNLSAFVGVDKPDLG